MVIRNYFFKKLIKVLIAMYPRYSYLPHETENRHLRTDISVSDCVFKGLDFIDKEDEDEEVYMQIQAGTLKLRYSQIQLTIYKRANGYTMVVDTNKNQKIVNFRSVPTYAQIQTYLGSKQILEIEVIKDNNTVKHWRFFEDREDM
jgi:hypothetical protein